MIKAKAILTFYMVVSFLFLAALADANIPEHVLKQKKAVVTILINDKDGNKLATATGFIIDSQGIIVTNNHVISAWAEDPGNVLLIKLENGSYYPMEKILATDEDNDIAIFRVDGKDLPTVKLINNAGPNQGESVIVIGSPLGLEMTVSDGIVSSVRDKGGVIQITAPISPGSSGSPVFNSKGEVVGVASFLFRGGQNLNFAISSSRIRKLLNDYRSRKKTGKLTAEDWAQKGVADFKLNRLDVAIDAFTKAIELKPDYAEAYVTRGSVYYFSKNDQQAIDDCTKAIELKPKNVMVYFMAFFMRGNAYARSGDNQQAINDYTKAIKINPDYAATYCNRGLSYVKLSNLQQAINDQTKAIALNPDYAEAYFLRGAAYVASGSDQMAMNDLSKAIELKHDQAKYYYFRGLEYDILNDYRLAIDDFTKTIALSPNDAAAYGDRGYAYNNLGDYQQAIKDCTEAIVLKPDYADAYYYRGFAWGKLKKTQQATEDFKAAAKLGNNAAQNFLIKVGIQW
jgi:tetratricopeptide (TPR) repeat protein